MARLSLQLGSALVVPFAASRRLAKSGRNWRLRALREAAAVGRDVGSRSGDRRTAPPSLLAQGRAPAKGRGE